MAEGRDISVFTNQIVLTGIGHVGIKAGDLTDLAVMGCWSKMF